MTLSSRASFAVLLVGLATVMTPCATYAQLGGGGNTCVFVFGTINGHSVTTPSIMVVVPPTDVVLGPTRVHVDPVNETFLGFTLTTPGADQTVNGTSLFVPGVDTTVPSFTATINDLNVSQKTCVNFGVVTPAVEIDVPASALAVPGALVDTPEITINALGVQKTVSGQTLTIAGQTIVIPGMTEVVPSQTVGTPDQTIAVNLNHCQQGLVKVLAAVFPTTPADFSQVTHPPAFDPPPPPCQ
jgi:hypothetical protein